MTAMTPTLTPASLRRLISVANGMPPVCFGVSCDAHGSCARYEAVNGADPQAPRMARCSTDMTRPGFTVKA